MEPLSEWIVHFIYVTVSTTGAKNIGYTYLDVREVRPDNSIHDTPNMRNRILVDHLDTQLIPDKTPRSLSAKQVLCAYSLLMGAIDMRQVDLNRIGLILAIVLEALDRPGSLDLTTILLNIPNKRPLDHTLMEKRSKRIPRIDELWTTSPSTCPVNTLLRWIPKSHLINLCRFVFHNLALKTHIA